MSKRPNKRRHTKTNPFLPATIILIATSALMNVQAAAPKKSPTLEYRLPADLKQTSDSEQRLDQWFRDAKFGVFLHFGAYSPLAGKYKGTIPERHYSEWILRNAEIPAKEYHQVAAQFNPSDFDAEEWVQVFKQTGARYVVITAKHHDGFALFKSKISPYNIVDATAFKRDIIKELSEVCHRNGLKFGVYYSQAQDWDEPDAPSNSQRRKNEHPDLPADFKPDMDRYIANKALPQVEELVKNYELDLIWFDTPKDMTYERAKLFSDMVRKHRPDCLINSRLIHGGRDRIKSSSLSLFDYASIRDKEVPDRKLPLYFESPDSVSSSYGYKIHGDVNYHTEKELIDRFVHTVCSGGNYLLNNGPMGNGKLDPEAVRLYGVIGEWMKNNSESLLDTRPNPFPKRPEWGDVSVNKAGDILYLHILNWPETGTITLKDLPGNVTHATYLANENAAGFKQVDSTLNITLPPEPLNEYNTVIKLTMENVETPVDWSTVEPVSTEPIDAGVVSFKDVGETQLADKDIMRRDPSDIINVNGTYYIWYTKIHKGAPRYPGGWAGTVWYATSKDGHRWVEQKQALDKGGKGTWDSVGTYTPNVLPYKGKFYLAYTAQSAEEPEHKYRQAAIGMAVADSPDGPWSRLEHNPVIAPGKHLSSPDGFLCDDAVFIVRNNKIFLYYKGFPKALDEKGRPIRNVHRRKKKGKPKGTFLLGSEASHPENPFTKFKKGSLHRGHEAVLWKAPDNSVGSFCLGWGEPLYYSAQDGIHFEAMNTLDGELPMAAGLYRADLEENGDGFRPAWGMRMEQHGLQRFEIIW